MFLRMLKSDNIGIADHLGVRLLIHDPDSQVYPQDNGLILQTGYMYLVSLTMVNLFGD